MLQRRVVANSVPAGSPSLSKTAKTITWLEIDGTVQCGATRLQCETPKGLVAADSVPVTRHDCQDSHGDDLATDMLSGRGSAVRHCEMLNRLAVSDSVAAAIP